MSATRLAMPDRHGDEWTVEDFDELVCTITSTQKDEVAAELLRRDLPEVQEAARFLIDPHVAERLPAESRLPYLRGALLDPEYPWLENVEANHRGRLPPWPMGGDQTLAEYWDQGESLEFVAESLGVSELQVGLRCVRLGIADNLAEVIETLGDGQSGVMRERAFIALERSSATLDVYLDIQDGGSISVYLSGPDSELPEFCQRREDGTPYEWVKVPGVIPGEIGGGSGG